MSYFVAIKKRLGLQRKHLFFKKKQQLILKIRLTIRRNVGIMVQVLPVYVWPWAVSTF